MKEATENMSYAIISEAISSKIPQSLLLKKGKELFRVIRNEKGGNCNELRYY